MVLWFSPSRDSFLQSKGASRRLLLRTDLGIGNQLCRCYSGGLGCDQCGKEKETGGGEGNGSLGDALGECKSEMLKRAYFIALIMNEDFPLSPPKTITNTDIRHLNCDTVERRKVNLGRRRARNEAMMEKGETEAVIGDAYWLNSRQRRWGRRRFSAIAIKEAFGRVLP